MIPGSANPLLLATAAGAGGYQIERSLRFNSSDSAYLSRTPASAGNRKTWTWAGWVKRSAIGTAQNHIFVAGPATSSNATYIRLAFNTDDTFFIGLWTTSIRTTSAVFRDPSAWYHIVVAMDTANATEADRCIIYVNGVRQTVSGTVTQNDEYGINAAQLHHIGNENNQRYFNGYLADIHLIDGQALDPTSFGEFDANDVWQPKAFSGGSYGTNGFYLPFSDNSTAAALGTDTSGNSNTWTVNNISVAAGAGNDSLVDTPTSYGTDTGAGGEVRGNYATLNPLWNNGHILSNGNLDYAPPSPAAWTSVLSTFGMPSGKWYWEQTYISGSANCMAGFGNASSTLISYPTSPNSTGYDFVDGNIYGAGAGVSAGATLSAGDIMGISVDVDAGEAKFYKNGVLQTTLSHGITGTLFPLVSSYDGVGCVNFGQRPWAFIPPAGFKALCTTNLPEPVVAKPSEVMDVVLYNANGSTQTISGLGFAPDLVWSKSRNRAYPHGLHDSVRGAYKYLRSSGTNAETDTSGDPATYTLTSFNSDGFSVGQDGGAGVINNNAAGATTYVAWTWDAGSSTVTNTQGSITSQVRANPSAGFSIVSWTGNGLPNQTAGHGLNASPVLKIVKQRTGTFPWVVTSSLLGVDKRLLLNTTDAVGDAPGYYPADTSSTLGINGANVATWHNDSGSTYVAYCFAPVAGYSNGFSYTGNGSTDGSFVYLGFRPRLILLKCSSTTGNWTLLDTAREGYNVDNDPLYPNLSNAEGTTDLLDITSNGFKLRTTDASVNSSGAIYVGYAWAEAPFAYSRAR